MCPLRLNLHDDRRSMKVRIKDNSIRIRLSQSEVESFQKEGLITSTTNFPGGQSLRYELKRHDGDFTASFAEGVLCVAVPLASAEQWRADEQVEMEGWVELNNNEKLRLLVEKDFACLTVRDHEDESDNFPNPNLSC